MSFKIGQLKIRKTPLSKLHLPKYAPVPTFRWLITGPCESGKTYSLVYTLNKAYKGVFKRRIFFSGTISHDKTWGALKKGKYDQFIPEYNEDILLSIIEYQKTTPKPGRMLIVLDDLTSKDFHESPYLNDMIRTMRHYNISIIFLVQRYNLVSPAIRSQISHLTLFNITNAKELNLIAEDLPMIDKKGFLKIYQQCMKHTKIDYRPFLQINKVRNIISHCFEFDIPY